MKGSGFWFPPRKLFGLLSGNGAFWCILGAIYVVSVLLLVVVRVDVMYSLPADLPGVSAVPLGCNRIIEPPEVGPSTTVGTCSVD